MIYGACKIRCDVYACFRLTDLFGMSDLCSTHISDSVSGSEGNAFGADALMSVEGSVIHVETHKENQHPTCVRHAHARASNTVVVLKNGMQSQGRKAMVLSDFIDRHNYEGAAEFGRLQCLSPIDKLEAETGAGYTQ